jgi:hypothetical protein
VADRHRKSTCRLGKEPERHEYISHTYSLEDIQRFLESSWKEAFRFDSEGPDAAEGFPKYSPPAARLGAQEL